jgi:cytochrome c oxidase subunit 1
LLTFPTADAYHDEDLPLVRNFTPWVVAAIVLLLIAYVPPIYEAVTGPATGAPPYAPTSPLPARS